MEVSKIFDRYKLKIADDTIYDLVRERYVHFTPEEIVRQKTLKFLLNRLGIPKDRITVERSLGTLGVRGGKKRIEYPIFFLLRMDVLLKVSIMIRLRILNASEIISIDVYGDNKKLINDCIPEIEGFIEEVLPKEEDSDSIRESLLEVVIDLSEFIS